MNTQKEPSAVLYGQTCRQMSEALLAVSSNQDNRCEVCLSVSQVQEEMLKVHWREDVLTLPHCQAQVGGRHGLIFIGPRIKMGIYEGVPTRVAPHTTTGSADYFGPLVNRYTALLRSHLSTCACVCVSWCKHCRQPEPVHSIGKPHWQNPLARPAAPLASPIGNSHWQARLAKLIGKAYWQAPLASPVGQPNWPAPLANPIGKPHWPSLLASLIGKPYWPASLASPISIACSSEACSSALRSASALLIFRRPGH